MKNFLLKDGLAIPTECQKIFYIYEIKNLKNGKTYIGKHVSKKLPDNYFGSGIYLKNSIKKHGIENFQKTILDFAENLEELSRKEKEWITAYKSQGKAEFNLTQGGEGGDTLSQRREKDNLKRSQSLKEYWTPDHINSRNNKIFQTWNSKTEKELRTFRKNHSKYLYKRKGVEESFMTLRELSDLTGLSVHCINMAAKNNSTTRNGLIFERTLKT